MKSAARLPMAFTPEDWTKADLEVVQNNDRLVTAWQLFPILMLQNSFSCSAVTYNSIIIVYFKMKIF